MKHRVGDELPELVIPEMQRSMFVRYAGASGDFNPIHFDQEFARSAGYPTVFAQGMLQAAILATCATDYLGAAGIRRFKVRFARQVWPGDGLTCSGRVEAVDRAAHLTSVTVSLLAACHDGAVVATGEAQFEVCEGPAPAPGRT